MDWLEWRSVCVFDYGMTEAEFMRSTPAQLSAIAERYLIDRERQEFGPALICATVCNLMGGKETAEDFMPSRQKAKTEQGPESITDMAHMLANMFGGEVVTDGK